ncbi:bile acid sodium symporter/ transporter isoform X1 [Zea mays]|nr:bile acid sodium symporter/ transporter isoform X1 [Zea mays]ONM33878.1 putative sodium/metabolite cotransporter BASS1 chloroplastic [Zea mays]|eukprot:XP_020405398.1 bile acid sodium symporter/ transporter isoform X2 [Zea mays]
MAPLLLLPLPLPLRPIPAENSISRLAPRPRFPRPFSRRRLRLPALLQVQCLAATGPAAPAPRWHAALSAAAGLYPAYVAAGASVAFTRPEAFRWFVALAPGSYTATLGFIMLAMGLTLQLSDFAALLRDRPLAILFGCAAQYTIMPAFGAIISHALGLPPSLSAGLILLGCCPGGTASNVVTLVAQGDVPLSVVMTVCSTLAAVFLTPLLTKILAGAYIPVDAVKLSLSTLQVVVAPILLGSLIQTAFPSVAQFLSPFAPLMAVLASSLLASSVFSENFVRLRSTIADASPVNGMFFGDVGTVIFSVFLLHFAGFFVGYAAAAIGGFKEKQRRAISIEDTEIDESSKSSSGLTLKLMGVKYLGGSTSWLIINIRL